jgi:ABC-type protease/lipase transport system fused ATPase/permease subunit
MLTTITVAAIICAVILEVIRRRMFMHWGSWIERSFGPTLFAHCLKNESGQFPSVSKATRDIGTIRSFVSGSALIAWLDAIWAPLFIGCVYLISPILGYIVLVASLLALGLGVLNEFLTREIREASYIARKDSRDLIASAEQNQETVESLNMASNFAEHWSSSTFTKLDESLRGRKIHIYFAALMRLIARFLRVSVLAVGIWLVIEQSLSLGAVIAANVLARIAYSLVQNAMLRWQDLVTAKRAYLKIKSALDKRHAANISMPVVFKNTPCIINDVRYRHPRKPSSIFRKLNIALNPGDILFVVGPSGSGKTTFSKLVSGLLSPRDGSIKLGEVDVYRLQQRAQTLEIGKLPQHITLFPGTVRQNIARMSEGDIGSVIEAAKIAGIHETIIDLPDGYDTEIEDNDPILSHGHRKSIALARAFYEQPQLIVLDEPIPHLDYQLRSGLFNGLKRLKEKGAIIVLTTQSKRFCNLADKVLVLDGPKHHLLQSSDKILLFQKQGIFNEQEKRTRNRKKNIDIASADSELNDDLDRKRLA